MISKNLCLSFIAFPLAIGGAFTSVVLPEDVFVKARINNVVGPIRCVNTRVACDATGNAICTVQVPVSNGSGTQTATTSGSTGFMTYKTGCQVLLGNNGSPLVVHEADFAIYELVSVP